MVEGPDSGREITQVLAAVASGEPQASEKLLPLVYEELRQVAARQLANERPGQTLQATALVHEAYLRLLGGAESWQNRRHFFSAAAEAMRRILVERARRKRRQRHGGSHRRVDLDAQDIPIESADVDLLALDEVLDQLAAEDAAKAELVKLRFFAGLSEQEAADVLGISRATAARYWAYARAWLFDRLRDDADGDQKTQADE
ncbi:MAG TPA: ECF-type sigma factor [Pirellulales bacterium]|jgi:RNA polymerase sigma factor (TIGR02999 family)|nr:ECF-type sigma factor [Pirellulales bacterium]